MMKLYRMPYCVPAWGWAEHRAILRCLLTGSLLRGRDVGTLCALARCETGMKHVFALDSGRGAILAALRAWGVGRGDRVILPSYCCASVLEPVLQCEAEPLFCDIGEDFNLDPDHALSLAGDRVRAIVVAHLFGRPAAIDRIVEGLEAAGRRDRVMVIDDAAQSYGARLHGRQIGTLGDAGIISFGPGKTMTATGGGLLLTRSDALAGGIARVAGAPAAARDKFAALAYWLLFRRWRAFTLPFFPLFRPLVRQSGGGRGAAAMANLDAAIALAQWRRLPRFLDIRMRRRKELDSRISAVAGLAALPAAKGLTEVCTKYVARADSETSPAAEALRRFYRERGIEMQPLYEPIHLKGGRRTNGSGLPRTTRDWQRIVQIPVEPSIGESSWQAMASELFAALGEAERGTAGGGRACGRGAHAGA